MLTPETTPIAHPLAYRLASGLANKTLVLPITLTFKTAQEAQHHRCRIYAFRRLVRQALDKAQRSGNASAVAFFDPLASALESLESPRIDYGSKEPRLVLRSKASNPSIQDALSQLNSMSTIIEPEAEASLSSPADLANLFEPEPEFDDIVRVIDGTQYTFRVPYGDNSSDKMLLMKSKLPNSGIVILDSVAVDSE